MEMERALVAWLMAVLGADNLFPWLCFITAVDHGPPERRDGKVIHTLAVLASLLTHGSRAAGQARRHLPF